MFSRGFWERFKNIYFVEHLRKTDCEFRNLPEKGTFSKAASGGCSVKELWDRGVLIFFNISCYAIVPG